MADKGKHGLTVQWRRTISLSGGCGLNAAILSRRALQETGEIPRRIAPRHNVPHGSKCSSIGVFNPAHGQRDRGIESTSVFGVGQ